MAKVLVLYYSAYGHIEAMANAVAEGARRADASCCRGQVGAGLAQGLDADPDQIKRAGNLEEREGLRARQYQGGDSARSRGNVEQSAACGAES